MSADYSIVPGSILHIKPLSAHLRPAAYAFVGKLGVSPRMALRRALLQSFYCRTAMLDGEPAAMWGAQGSLLSDSATVWLALSRRAVELPLAVVRRARVELVELAQTGRKLYATVEAEDERALAFAMSLGFKPTNGIETGPGMIGFALAGKHFPAENLSWH